MAFLLGEKGRRKANFSNFSQPFDGVFLTLMPESISTDFLFALFGCHY
jgi:hypothetical protein